MKINSKTFFTDYKQEDDDINKTIVLTLNYGNNVVSVIEFDQYQDYEKYVSKFEKLGLNFYSVESEITL